MIEQHTVESFVNLANRVQEDTVNDVDANVISDDSANTATKAMVS